ncbi:MAG: hypothetical protein AAFZ49_07380, partial [Cyanobacteria bacterium J06659_2]
SMELSVSLFAPCMTGNAKVVAFKTSLMTRPQILKSILTKAGVSLFTSLLAFSPAAIAGTGTSVDSVFERITVRDGSFSAEYTDYLATPLRIREAVVSLPEGVEGSIDGIFIIDELGRLAYGCMDIPVVNGTDIFQACGWAAYLHSGEVTYQIEGSNFSADASEFVLSIELN